MDKADILDKQKFIYGGLQLLSSRLQVLGDRYLADYGLTTRQWLLTLAVAQFGDNTPTLNEVAKFMNSSHQNIRQMAAKLEEKGFIFTEKDQRDLRLIRLKLTEKTYVFWEKAENKIGEMLGILFTELSREDISSLYESIKKLYGKFIDNNKKYEIE